MYGFIQGNISKQIAEGLGVQSLYGGGPVTATTIWEILVKLNSLRLNFLIAK